MTKEEYKTTFKRLRRQLQQRAEKVRRKLRPEQYYQNKRQEFIDFIDEAKKTDWFVMPKETTWVAKVYNDNWTD